MRTSFVVAFLAIALVSCGSSEDLTYEYSYNGCSTGKHSFDSKDAYCSGLRSSSLNNGCAVDMRKQTFEQNCGGGFSET